MTEEDNSLEVHPEVVETTVRLARLLLQFGLTMRATYHEDGETLESDTTHTVMLGVMASAYAERYAPHLDRGKIAQFALVHDLVEVYAGDTVMFGKTEDAGKKEREEEALHRIRDEYDAVFPWIGETIEAYERLDTPEARYIKVFDKVLPKIVHALNKGKTISELGETPETMDDFHMRQFEIIVGTYGHDQLEALELLKAMNGVAREAVVEARERLSIIN